MAAVLVGIGAAPAHASWKELKTSYLGVTTGQAGLGIVDNVKYFAIWDLKAGNGLVWIDVRVPDGRSIRYSGIDNDYYDVPPIYYSVASWRLCDPYAGYCTGWVLA